MTVQSVNIIVVPHQQEMTMKKRKFKDPWMQKAYDHFRTSDITTDRRSSDRATYWDGRMNAGAKYSNRMPTRGTISYAIYMAGVDRSTDKETK